jgi:Type I phosphodiesterase / nucleotide pyrophosphatase
VATVGRPFLTNSEGASDHGGFARFAVDRLKFLRWSDLALCLSLANLCYLNVWHDLQGLENADLDYFRQFPLTHAFVVTAANVVILTVVLAISVALVRRSPTAPLHKAAQCGFFVLLSVPMRTLETYVAAPAVSGGGLSALILRVSVLSLAVVVLSAPVFVLTRPRPMIVRAARTIVLLLVPLFPVLLIHATWLRLQSPSRADFLDKPLALRLPDRATGAARVVWLIFDEMDERLAFRDRPPHVRLPEFDSFRRQALYATNAHPPARWTLVSMPALISGRPIAEAEPLGVDELRLTLRVTNEKVLWSQQPSVFGRARELGLNTAVVGWYHPYCRLLSASLTRCSWHPYLSATEALQTERRDGNADVAGGMWIQAKRQVSFMRPTAHIGAARAAETRRREDQWEKEQHRLDYLRIRQDALELVTDRHLALILVHWPVPHPSTGHDRSTRNLAMDDRDEYFDNVALADRALADLRLAMERAGVWEQTIVLISSDHGWRNDVRSQPAEAPRIAADGNPLPLVPFLLKLPGHDQPLEYAATFNTVLTHDLILGLIRGELLSPHAVVSWLDHNRARFAVN